MPDKQLTWGELKNFVNKLPENVLENEVRWWGEDRGGIINFAECLKEEYCKTEEGWEQKQFQEVDKFTSQEDIDSLESLPIGSPILHTD